MRKEINPADGTEDTVPVSFPEKQLREECAAFGVELTGQQVRQFEQYCRLLLEWNGKMNLTAITDIPEIITKHFVDSLTLVRIMPDISREKEKVIDVGTGAGFPGIPLKIAFPELEITLLDSLGKRVTFLNEVIRVLGLTGITAVHGRAEDIGRDKVSRETFDLCVSRAVANLSTLSEYCLPLVKVGGAFIPYKSGRVEEELQPALGALDKLGGDISLIDRFRLPNGDERVLIKITKVEKTPKRYPRKAGTPSKEPLS